MPVALPESIANRLLHQICDYLENKETISEFTKVQITRDLSNLNDEIPFEVCSAFFEISCGKVSEGLNRFDKVYAKFGRNDFITKNHLFALGITGRNILRQEKAYSYANESRSVVVLIDAILTASQYGDVDNLKKFLDILTPMEIALEKSKSDIEYAKNAYAEFIETYKQVDVDKSDVQKVLNRTLAILEKNSLDYTKSRLSSWDGQTLDMEFSINATLEKISQLNDEILDVMIDEDLPSKIVPHFTFPMPDVNKISQ